jgi:hypothetical protein
MRVARQEIERLREEAATSADNYALISKMWSDTTRQLTEQLNAQAERVGMCDAPDHRLCGDTCCRVCGVRNTVWHVDSELWNTVMGDTPDSRGHVVCMRCFVVAAEEAGIGTSGAWKLTPAITDTSAADVKDEAPQWAHAILTAFLTSQPLNFDGERPPADIRRRLYQAAVDGVLSGTPTVSECKYRLWSGKHKMWWRPNEVGYTNNVEEAGLYTKKAAMRCVAQSAFFGDPELVTRMVVAVDVTA